MYISSLAKMVASRKSSEAWSQSWARRAKKLSGRGKAGVREVDVRLRGHQPDGETQGIAESAVGVGKSEETDSGFRDAEQVTMSPVPVRISMDSTVSCTRPYLKEDDSMPSPLTAPPSVMVFNCGTTAGSRP